MVLIKLHLEKEEWRPSRCSTEEIPGTLTKNDELREEGELVQGMKVSTHDVVEPSKAQVVHGNERK